MNVFYSVILFIMIERSFQAPPKIPSAITTKMTYTKDPEHGEVKYKVTKTEESAQSIDLDEVGEISKSEEEIEETTVKKEITKKASLKQPEVIKHEETKIARKKNGDNEYEETTVKKEITKKTTVGQSGIIKHEKTKKLHKESDSSESSEATVKKKNNKTPSHGIIKTIKREETESIDEHKNLHHEENGPDEYREEVKYSKSTHHANPLLNHHNTQATTQYMMPMGTTATVKKHKAHVPGYGSVETEDQVVERPGLPNMYSHKQNFDNEHTVASQMENMIPSYQDQLLGHPGYPNAMGYSGIPGQPGFTSYPTSPYNQLPSTAETHFPPHMQNLNGMNPESLGPIATNPSLNYPDMNLPGNGLAHPSQSGQHTLSGHPSTVSGTPFPTLMQNHPNAMRYSGIPGYPGITSYPTSAGMTSPYNQLPSTAGTQFSPQVQNLSGVNPESLGPVAANPSLNYPQMPLGRNGLLHPSQSGQYMPSGYLPNMTGTPFPIEAQDLNAMDSESLRRTTTNPGLSYPGLNFPGNGLVHPTQSGQYSPFDHPSAMSETQLPPQVQTLNGINPESLGPVATNPGLNYPGMPLARNGLSGQYTPSPYPPNMSGTPFSTETQDLNAMNSESFRKTTINPGQNYPDMNFPGNVYPSQSGQYNPYGHPSTMSETQFPPKMQNLNGINPEFLGPAVTNPGLNYPGMPLARNELSGQYTPSRYPPNMSETPFPSHTQDLNSMNSELLRQMASNQHLNYPEMPLAGNGLVHPTQLGQYTPFAQSPNMSGVPLSPHIENVNSMSSLNPELIQSAIPNQGLHSSNMMPPYPAQMHDLSTSSLNSSYEHNISNMNHATNPLVTNESITSSSTIQSNPSVSTPSVNRKVKTKVVETHKVGGENISEKSATTRTESRTETRTETVKTKHSPDDKNETAEVKVKTKVKVKSKVVTKEDHKK